jgi:hypothetical protein
MRNADCGLRNAEFGARSSECAGGGFRQLTPRVARIACFRGVESHALSLSGDPSAPLGIPGHRPTRVRRPRGHLRGTRRRAPSSHPREETPRLRSGTTVIAPLQSGDPSTALGVTCFEGASGAFFTCHLDQASASERVERSPELYERRGVWSGPDAHTRHRHRAHGTRGLARQHAAFVLFRGCLDSTGQRCAPASSARHDRLGGLLRAG